MTPPAFLATPAARKVHEGVMERLLPFAATAAGRQRLRLLAFQPGPEAADAHARQVMEHKAMVAPLDRVRVHGLLRRIRPPAEPTPRFDPTCIVLCETEDAQERLLRLGLQRWAAVGGADDLAQAAGCDLVIFLYDDGMDLSGLDNVVEVRHDAPPGAIAPEASLAWLEANRDALEAAAELASLLGRASRIPEALQAAAAATPAGSPTVPPVPVRKAVEEVRKQVEGSLRERLAGLTLSGADLVASLGRGLPVPVQKAIDGAIDEGHRMLAQRTGLVAHPYAAGQPIAVDEREVAAMERLLQVRGRLERHHALARAAQRVDALRPALEAELAHWQAFDAPFALGCFAHHHGLRPARFGPVLAFRDSLHLDLAGVAGAQPIAYRLGGGEGVAVLTGANSGGKTTLLEHVAQLAIMARLGLPVAGQDVEVPWLDELHYVTARRSLDAGAFEAFLRGFLPLALGPARRLVLADEVEAVTELEAAGRILGFFLDRIARGDSMAIVVSHMAPQLLQHCRAPVRIDGIEATGLDEGNRLIVDRTPRMGVMARSTPELIVQRLAATSKGPLREICQDLLSTFRPDAPPQAALVHAVARKGKRKATASPPP